MTAWVGQPRAERAGPAGPTPSGSCQTVTLGDRKGHRKSPIRDRPGQRLSLPSAKQGEFQRRIGSGIKFCGKVRVDALGKGSLVAFESVSQHIEGYLRSREKEEVAKLGHAGEVWWKALLFLTDVLAQVPEVLCGEMFTAASLVVT